MRRHSQFLPVHGLRLVEALCLALRRGVLSSAETEQLAFQLTTKLGVPRLDAPPVPEPQAATHAADLAQFAVAARRCNGGEGDTKRQIRRRKRSIRALNEVQEKHAFEDACDHDLLSVADELVSHGSDALLFA